MTFFHILRLWHWQTNLKEGLVLYRYITRRAGLLLGHHQSTLLCACVAWVHSACAFRAGHQRLSLCWMQLDGGSRQNRTIIVGGGGECIEHESNLAFANKWKRGEAHEEDHCHLLFREDLNYTWLTHHHMHDSATMTFCDTYWLNRCNIVIQVQWLLTFLLTMKSLFKSYLDREVVSLVTIDCFTFCY